MDEILGVFMGAVFESLRLAAGQVKAAWTAVRDRGAEGVPLLQLVAASLHILSTIPVAATAGRVTVGAFRMADDDLLLFFALFLVVPIALGVLFMAFLHVAGSCMGAVGVVLGDTWRRLVGVGTAAAATIAGIGVIQTGRGGFGWPIVIVNGGAFVAGLAVVLGLDERLA